MGKEGVSEQERKEIALQEVRMRESQKEQQCGQYKQLWYSLRFLEQQIKDGKCWFEKDHPDLILKNAEAIKAQLISLEWSLKNLGLTDDKINEMKEKALHGNYDYWVLKG